MSRGPGVWQQRVLAELDHMGADNIYWVTDVVRKHLPAPARTDFVAARRAVKRLTELGKIRAGLFRYRDASTGQLRDSLAFTRPESVRESNVYYGNNLTPSWHTAIPAKYAEQWQEWNPSLKA